MISAKLSLPFFEGTTACGALPCQGFAASRLPRPSRWNLGTLDKSGATGIAWAPNWLDGALPQLSLHTPVGAITVSAEDEAIVALDWGWGRDQEPTPALLRARHWLQSYFDGVTTPMDLPLRPFGTSYRQRVWRQVCEIPPGAVWSYRQVAEAAGGSPRSVGMAMASNPIPLLIPCHRVLGHGAGGRFSLGGYSGGEGVETKRFLLNLEARMVGQEPAWPDPTDRTR